MKKTFIAILLIITFFCNQVSESSAVVDPFTVALAASALLHAAVVGGYIGWRSYKRENGGARNPSGTKVTPNGTIGRDARVDWVDLNAVDFVKGKDVTAKATHAELKAAVRADPAGYPQLKNALTDTDQIIAEANSDTNWYLGSFYNENGLWYQISGVLSTSVYTSGSASSSTGNISYNSVLGYYYGTHTFAGSNGYTRVTYKFNRIGGTLPPANEIDVPSDEFAKRVAGASSPLSSPADVSSVFYGEIDKYLTGKSGSISFVDTSDSSQVDSAPSFPSPSVPSYPAYQAAVAARDASVASQAATSSAQSAVTAAQGAVNAAQTNYGNSGSPADYQKLQDALKGLADAQAALDKLKADQARQAAEDAKEEAKEEAEKEEDKYTPSPYGEGSYGDNSQLGNFGDRFNGFMNTIKNSPVFSFAENAIGNIPGGGSSVYSFTAGRYGSHSFDLETLSGIFATLKAVILICFGFVCVRIITLKGGSG